MTPPTVATVPATGEETTQAVQELGADIASLSEQISEVAEATSRLGDRIAAVIESLEEAGRIRPEPVRLRLLTDV